MMKRIAYVLSWVSGALAVFCAIAYILTFFGQNLLAALAGFSPCLLFFIFGLLVFYGIRHGENNVTNYVAKHHQWILTALTLLVFLNFFWNFQQMNGGSPERQDGRYILSNHGTFVRELSESEYLAMRVAELRLMSGHPILFFALAAFGWQGVLRTLETKREQDP
jgi:hypothetical protein